MIKRTPADNLARVPTPDHSSEADHEVASPSVAHVTEGDVLWTLTHGESTAQASRWITAHGYELEMHIWRGTRVPGEEDLSWTQLYTSEESLTEAAAAKKRQLENGGWVER